MMTETFRRRMYLRKSFPTKCREKTGLEGNKVSPSRPVFYLLLNILRSDLSAFLNYILIPVETVFTDPFIGSAAVVFFIHIKP